jgi:predicted RNase H-like nuclease (RuvC/YqgF family)
MVPDSEKNEDKKEVITKSDLILREDTVNAIQDMAKNAVKLQQDLAGIMAPALRKTLRSMSVAGPALQGMAQTVVSIRNVGESMADSLRVLTSSRASSYDEQIADIMSKMMDVNDQMSRIASELGSKFELLSDYSNVMVLKKPVDIQRIVKSGSNRAQVKIRALENALASLDDELNEKDMEYKELRRRIRELREKTRKISVE